MAVWIKPFYIHPPSVVIPDTAAAIAAMNELVEKDLAANAAEQGRICWADYRNWLKNMI